MYTDFIRYLTACGKTCSLFCNNPN